MEISDKEIEKILDKNAKKHMIEWNLESFKISHKRLFRTFIESMKELNKKLNEK